MNKKDTYYAHSTPVGVSATATIRISGPAAFETVSGLTNKPIGFFKHKKAKSTQPEKSESDQSTSKSKVNPSRTQAEQIESEQSPSKSKVNPNRSKSKRAISEKYPLTFLRYRIVL